MSRTARINLLLVLICTGLFAAIYQTVAAPVVPQASAPVETMIPGKPEIVRYDVPTVQRFAAITERPIFSPLRRPAARQQAPSTTARPPSAVVTGVIKTGAAQRAIVRSGDMPAKIVGVGAMLDGWRIAAISAGRVILERDGARHVLEIGADAEPGSPAAIANRDSGSTTPRARRRAAPVAVDELPDE